MTTEIKCCPNLSKNECNNYSIDCKWLGNSCKTKPCTAYRSKKQCPTEKIIRYTGEEQCRIPIPRCKWVSSTTFGPVKCIDYNVEEQENQCGFRDDKGCEKIRKSLKVRLKLLRERIENRRNTKKGGNKYSKNKTSRKRKQRKLYKSNKSNKIYSKKQSSKKTHNKKNKRSYRKSKKTIRRSKK